MRRNEIIRIEHIIGNKRNKYIGDPEKTIKMMYKKLGLDKK